jgi:hypothetical protein
VGAVVAPVAGVAVAAMVVSVVSGAPVVVVAVAVGTERLSLHRTRSYRANSDGVVSGDRRHTPRSYQIISRNCEITDRALR